MAEQEYLISTLPSNMRNDVDLHQHERLINEIAFFRTMNPVFVLEIMGSLYPMRCNAGDKLYSQGDIADEVYFVSKGDFNLFTDISSMLNLPDGLIDPKT